MKEYQLFNEDCITKMNDFQKEGKQFDLSIFSPPFSSLYAYTNQSEDMGNSRESDDEFLLHFEFFVKALFPIIKDGRNVCVHIQNPVRSMTHHNRFGIWDLRGEFIRMFEKVGFWYFGEVTIWKNPQAQSIRTKSNALTFSQFVKDSMKSRPALADYILIFKKPGENAIPVTSELKKNSFNFMEREDITNEDWKEWASPIWVTNQEGFMIDYPNPVMDTWFDINETKTLNVRKAKSEKDEKHLSPLQLDLIERCIRLWSNKNETVFSPFAGIGSEGYQSLLLSRKFVGTELKIEYYEEAIKNLNTAIMIRDQEKSQVKLF